MFFFKYLFTKRIKIYITIKIFETNSSQKILKRLTGVYSIKTLKDFFGIEKSGCIQLGFLKTLQKLGSIQLRF